MKENCSTQIYKVDKTEKVNLDLLNEHIVSLANKVRGKMVYLRKKYQNGFHTSDIIPPYCRKEYSIMENIDNIFTSFNNTMATGLFLESEYIKMFESQRALSSIIESEKSLIFEFLAENGLIEKFNAFTASKKKSTVKVLHSED
jgi:vacuolar-type H+-ATPase catalytic subunit A/Vma1